jgi:hypothetical protein
MLPQKNHSFRHSTLSTVVVVSTTAKAACVRGQRRMVLRRCFDAVHFFVCLPAALTPGACRARRTDSSARDVRASGPRLPSPAPDAHAPAGRAGAPPFPCFRAGYRGPSWGRCWTARRGPPGAQTRARQRAAGRVPSALFGTGRHWELVGRRRPHRTRAEAWGSGRLRPGRNGWRKRRADGAAARPRACPEAGLARRVPRGPAGRQTGGTPGCRARRSPARGPRRGTGCGVLGGRLLLRCAPRQGLRQRRRVSAPAAVRPGGCMSGPYFSPRGATGAPLPGGAPRCPVQGLRAGVHRGPGNA